MQAEEMKDVIQWERFSILKSLVNTVAYVQRALSKTQTNTFVVGIEEEEIAKQSSSVYYNMNSLVKRLILPKLKTKLQKAAKLRNCHASLMKKDLFEPKSELAEFNWISMEINQYC